MLARISPLPTLARLALYLAALLVLGTAHLPDARPETGVVIRTAAPPAGSTAPAPVRLLLLGILVTGIAVDVLRRRAIWH